MRVYRITRDVSGEAYRRVLEAALDEASTFSLVWRHQLRFAASATEVGNALRGLQLRKETRHRWPGTILHGKAQRASVVTYRAAPAALPTLLEPGSLFAWRAPTYPEDLSFATDKAVCLATVSHEADGWIISPSLARAVGQSVTLVRETMDEREWALFKNDDRIKN